MGCASTADAGVVVAGVVFRVVGVHNKAHTRVELVRVCVQRLAISGAAEAATHEGYIGSHAKGVAQRTHHEQFAGVAANTHLMGPTTTRTHQQ